MRLPIRIIIETTGCTESQANSIELELFHIPEFYWGEASRAEMVKTIKFVARKLGVIK